MVKGNLPSENLSSVISWKKKQLEVQVYMGFNQLLGIMTENLEGIRLEN
jgi:hypothetical protein